MPRASKVIVEKNGIFYPHRRFALVIGNDLHCSRNDADEVAKFLGSKCEFETRVLKDASTANMRDALRDLRKLADKGDAGDETAVLFYFSGHGRMQHGNTELEPHGKVRADEQRIGSDEVARTLAKAAAVVIAIYDCCRGEVGDADDWKPRTGIANVYSIFAALPNKFASTGPYDGLSPFTEAFLDSAKSPAMRGRTIADVMHHAQQDKLVRNQKVHEDKSLSELIVLVDPWVHWLNTQGSKFHEETCAVLVNAMKNRHAWADENWMSIALAGGRQVCGRCHGVPKPGIIVSSSDDDSSSDESGDTSGSGYSDDSSDSDINTRFKNIKM